MSATRPSTEFTWATSGTKTAPSAAQRLVGWIFRQKPAYDIVNYLYGQIGDWFAYLDGGGGFDSLHAADAALAIGEHAVVDEWGGAGVPGEPRTSAGGNTGGAYLIATDGRTVFYVRNDSLTVVRSYDRTLGTAGSTYTVSNPVVSIACDGTTLFIASGTLTTWNVDAYEIATGDAEGTWAAGTTSPRLAAYLGDVIVVGTNVDGGTGDAVRYTKAGSLVWTYNHGAALTSVAASGRYVFVAGAAGTGSNTLRCLSGSAGAVVWSSTETTPVILGANGRAVFVDGSSGTLRRRGAADGTVGVSLPTFAAAAPVAAALDHEYLWIIEAGSERLVGYDAEDLSVAIVGTEITSGAGDGLTVATDGASVYVGRANTTANVVSRCYRPNTPTRFRKCAVTDVRDLPHLVLAPSR